VDAGYEEMLEEGTRRAQTLLDKLLFSEAQSVYHEVLRLADEIPSCSTGTSGRPAAAQRATVAAVSGLAESFARQSRTQSSTSEDDQTGSVPWLRLNVQVYSYFAVSLFHRTHILSPVFADADHQLFWRLNIFLFLLQT